MPGPASKYLIQDVGTVLVQCLKDVCEVRPSDPIEYMAYWLYKSADAEIYFYEKILFSKECQLLLLDFHKMQTNRHRTIQTINHKIKQLKEEICNVKMNQFNMLAAKLDTCQLDASTFKPEYPIEKDLVRSRYESMISFLKKRDLSGDLPHDLHDPQKTKKKHHHRITPEQYNLKRLQMLVAKAQARDVKETKRKPFKKPKRSKKERVKDDHSQHTEDLDLSGGETSFEMDSWSSYTTGSTLKSRHKHGNLSDETGSPTSSKTTQELYRKRGTDIDIAAITHRRNNLSILEFNRIQEKLKKEKEAMHQAREKIDHLPALNRIQEKLNKEKEVTYQAREEIDHILVPTESERILHDEKCKASKFRASVGSALSRASKRSKRRDKSKTSKESKASKSSLSSRDLDVDSTKQNQQPVKQRRNLEESKASRSSLSSRDLDVDSTKQETRIVNPLQKYKGFGYQIKQNKHAQMLKGKLIEKHPYEDTHQFDGKETPEDPKRQLNEADAATVMSSQSLNQEESKDTSSESLDIQPFSLDLGERFRWRDQPKAKEQVDSKTPKKKVVKQAQTKKKSFIQDEADLQTGLETDLEAEQETMEQEPYTDTDTEAEDERRRVALSRKKRRSKRIIKRRKKIISRAASSVDFADDDDDDDDDDGDDDTDEKQSYVTTDSEEDYDDTLPEDEDKSGIAKFRRKTSRLRGKLHVIKKHKWRPSKFFDKDGDSEDHKEEEEEEAATDMNIEEKEEEEEHKSDSYLAINCEWSLGEGVVLVCTHPVLGTIRARHPTAGNLLGSPKYWDDKNFDCHVNYQDEIYVDCDPNMKKPPKRNSKETKTTKKRGAGQ